MTYIRHKRIRKKNGEEVWIEQVISDFLGLYGKPKINISNTPLYEIENDKITLDEYGPRNKKHSYLEKISDYINEKKSKVEYTLGFNSENKLAYGYVSNKGAIPRVMPLRRIK